jgi:tRNA A-37 threonylcarbamoyl transferase component Bud32
MRRFLGEGAFGRVYEAYDPQLDRLVALKVAKPEQLHSQPRVQRFLREARAAANLRHPNIVAVFDSGSADGHHFIASALIHGQSLETKLAGLPEGQGLDFRQSVEIVRKLAEALAYAHGKGVVHRDVKPANVMLDEGGEPLLMDFGLAARDEDEAKLTQEKAALGTPAYMAPEQSRGQAEPASDQYSLGCALYELLTGQTPFSGPPEIQLVLHQTEEPPAPRQLNPRVPRDLETICRKCLEKESGQRYADCQALADDLRRWLEGEPVSVRPPGLAERLLKWGRRNPALAGLVGVTGLLVLLLVGFGVGLFYHFQVQQQRERAELAKGAAEKAKGEADVARLDAEAQRGEATRQRERAERLEYASHIQAAHHAYLSGDVPLALAHLEQCRWDLIGWEYRYVQWLCRGSKLTLFGHTGDVRSVGFSLDGKRLASACLQKVKV